jgi:hypothetical protein
MESTATPSKHRFAESGAAYRAARHPDPDSPPILSQAKLAEAVGTTRRHIIKIENGEHRPGRPLRNRIADVLGVERSTLPCAADDSPFPRRTGS